MLTLYGVSVTAENARHIMASLFAVGSPAAMSAAAAIEKGVDHDLYAMALGARIAGRNPCDIGEPACRP